LIVPSLRTAVDVAVPMHTFNVGDPADTHSHATTPEQMVASRLCADGVDSRRRGEDRGACEEKR